MYQKAIFQCLEKNPETSYIKAGFAGNDLLSISVETYEEDNLKDSLNVVFKDTKTRHIKTLERLNLTKEDLLNGMNEKTAAKMISDYFICHDGMIVAEKAEALIHVLDKLMRRYHYRFILSQYFDIEKLANECDQKKSSDIKETFQSCMKKYKRWKRMEKNKKACVVKYAYYWENDRRSDTKWIVCRTSIGDIYYDLMKKEWKVTKKETKNSGLVIASVDIPDVIKQLNQRYRVSGVVELERYLRPFFFTKKNSNNEEEGQ